MDFRELPNQYPNATLTEQSWPCPKCEANLWTLGTDVTDRGRTADGRVFNIHSSFHQYIGCLNCGFDPREPDAPSYTFVEGPPCKECDNPTTMRIELVESESWIAGLGFRCRVPWCPPAPTSPDLRAAYASELLSS